MAVTGSTTGKWTGQQTGTADDAREAVLDAIVDMAPMETPFLAMMFRGKKPSTTEQEWIVDYSGAYPTASAAIANAMRVGEGQDFVGAAAADRIRMFNRTGIWRSEWGVTDSQEASDLFGMESEFGYQEIKNSRKLARDWEIKIVNSEINSDSAGPNTASTVTGYRDLGGLVQQITTPASFVRSGALATGATAVNLDAGTTTGPGSSSFVEGDLIQAVQTMSDRGGIAGTLQLMMPSAVKVIVSKMFAPYPSGTATPGSSATAMPTVYRRRYGTDEATSIDLTIDRIIVDPNVECYCHVARAVPASTILGVQFDYFHLFPFRDFTVYDIAQVGPSRNAMIEAELTCGLIAPNTAMRIFTVS